MVVVVNGEKGGEGGEVGRKEGGERGVIEIYKYRQQKVTLGCDDLQLGPAASQVLPRMNEAS